jgi:phosphoglycolate phosphatase-like HAD superfamily hydrolase
MNITLTDEEVSVLKRVLQQEEAAGRQTLKELENVRGLTLTPALHQHCNTLRVVLEKLSLDDGPALYVWEWVGGGYREAYACNAAEAREQAAKLWPGHDITNLRRLNKEQADAYWKNLALWD